MAKQKQTGANVRNQDQSWFEKLSSSKRDLVCIAFMFVILLVLFNRIIFEDMVFSDSGDTATSESWQEAGKHLQETEHIEPLWFPYIFSGMPGFGSLAYAPRNVNYLQTAIQLVGRYFFLDRDVSWMVLHFFLGGIGMFLLVRQLKFSHLPSLLAALVFMINPYFLDRAGAGHGSELISLSYIPFLFLLTYNLFQRRDILSFGLLAAAIGTQLLAYHVQMVFYTFMILGLYLLYESALDIKREPLLVTKKGILFLLAVVLGFVISAYVYLSVEEYSHYSIRGSGAAGVPGGLTYDYATNWSFHPFEMMNYLIPSFFGYSSGYVTDFQGQQTALPLYWGWMPFTESTMYLGIVPLFLGFIALIFKRDRLTKFLAVLTVIVFLIAFGKHFSFVYDLMFNYFPFFNKFRVPAMILHLVPFTFGILAAYGLGFFADIHEKSANFDIVKMKKRVVYVLAGLGGLLLVGLAMKSGIYSFLSDFMFVKEGDLQQYGQQLLSVFKQKRFDVLWDDYVRFTVLSGLFFALILFYINKRVRFTTFAAALIALLVVDLYTLDAKNISPKPNTASKEHFQPDATVQFLQTDTTLYRIYPITHGIFMDNSYMYHGVQSIGGYSPAKLRIYQEVLDSLGIDPPAFPLQTNIIDMLNVKYIVSPGKLPDDKFTVMNVDQSKPLVVYKNPGVLPRAFFVDEPVVARTKGDVFRLLRSFDPRRTAILEKDPAQKTQRSDSTSVEMVQYGAHRIDLKTYSSSTSLLVLSEVYYPAGWKAYIDDAETEIYKTNYILRSVIVPNGSHAVSFRFDSSVYRLGFLITQIGWGMAGILIVVGILRLPQVRQKLKKEEAAV